jgi:serine/threonine protein kinase
VYLARDARLGREVAIKAHHAAGGARRLHLEAVAMARLAHPNVVAVFEVGDLAGRPFVVMEYVTGTTLRGWLAAAPRSVDEILAMVIAAGEGVAAANDAGLVHRDIKPENVLIGADGRARVGDFGLACELDANEAPQIQPHVPEYLIGPVTRTGAMRGTPAYMSPEQFAGMPVDARADQFAFCVTAWEALWGERPFAGSTVVHLYAAITLGNRRAPPRSPKVPSRVRAALERGLSVDPADRFATMHELLDALRPVPARRRPWLVTAGAIAAAGVAALVLMRGPSQPVRDSAVVAELVAVRTDQGRRQAGLASPVPASASQTGVGRFRLRGVGADVAPADEAEVQAVIPTPVAGWIACALARSCHWMVQATVPAQLVFE